MSIFDRLVGYMNNVRIGRAAVKDRATMPLASRTRFYRLRKVRRWGYQLQNVSSNQIAKSSTDLVVIDSSRDGTKDGEWSKAELQHMRKGGRIVLAYTSIGEAETYRAYWGAAWRPGAPSWLDEENPDWKGNYKVRFWNEDWKNIVRNNLLGIMEQGFDGAYLDIIDAYEYYERPEDMIMFVIELATFCRAIRPDFMIVPQNGDGLLQYPEYVACIDAMGREDFVYDQDGLRRSSREQMESLDAMHPLKVAGKPIFAVEYMQPAHAKTHWPATTYERMLRDGLCPLIVFSRDLDNPPA